ncbi:MAG: hypothetical protein LRS48_01180 [Desulfurococcales archaeon]|nr:hypothetical protein [Desulfurococcales archaeon]
MTREELYKWANSRGYRSYWWRFQAFDFTRPLNTGCLLVGDRFGPCGDSRHALGMLTLEEYYNSMYTASLSGCAFELEGSWSAPWLLPPKPPGRYTFAPSRPGRATVRRVDSRGPCVPPSRSNGFLAILLPPGEACSWESRIVPILYVSCEPWEECEGSPVSVAEWLWSEGYPPIVIVSDSWLLRVPVHYPETHYHYPAVKAAAYIGGLLPGGVYPLILEWPDRRGRWPPPSKAYPCPERALLHPLAGYYLVALGARGVPVGMLGEPPSMGFEAYALNTARSSLERIIEGFSLGPLPARYIAAVLAGASKLLGPLGAFQLLASSGGLVPLHASVDGREVLSPVTLWDLFSQHLREHLEGASLYTTLEGRSVGGLEGLASETLSLAVRICNHLRANGGEVDTLPCEELR